MKSLIRVFFRTLRVILGPVLLLKEKLTAPKGVVRSPEDQAKVDRACQQLALYQFATCPFCIKVRQELRRLSLTVELRNTQHDPAHRQALLDGGGKPQVPCLAIAEANGQTRWLYESSDIIAYLRERFPA
jgi:glutaredoxin